MVELKQVGEGLSLGGVYTLEHWIRGDGAGSFFAARTGEGERLLVKVAPDSGQAAEDQLALWQRARQLRHAHLLYVRDAGRTEIGGAGYVYGVFENPDEVLSSAIEQEPLSREDTRTVLEAALSALRYLHSQGLVHASVDAQHVVAVGETVKLTTDSLRESDDLEGHAEDVRQLGVLVQTLRAPEPLDDTMATIVRHATEPDARNRWTLAEIDRELRNAPVTEPPAPVTAEPEPVIAAESVPAPSPVMPVVAAEPVVPPAPTLPPTPTLPAPVHHRDAGAASPGGFPKWIFAGVAALLLFILVANLRRKPESSQAPRPAQPGVERVAPPPSKLPERPARSEAAREVEPKPSPLVPASTGGRAMWRVIAFTYTSRELASQKAKQVNERWPEMRAGVFSPKDKRGYYYLVALGGRMNRVEASRLQRKARGLGLPRDTYVQNYSE